MVELWAEQWARIPILSSHFLFFFCGAITFVLFHIVHSWVCSILCEFLSLFPPSPLSLSRFSLLLRLSQSQSPGSTALPPAPASHPPPLLEQDVGLLPGRGVNRAPGAPIPNSRDYRDPKKDNVNVGRQPPNQGRYGLSCAHSSQEDGSNIFGKDEYFALVISKSDKISTGNLKTITFINLHTKVCCYWLITMFFSFRCTRRIHAWNGWSTTSALPRWPYASHGWSYGPKQHEYGSESTRPYDGLHGSWTEGWSWWHAWAG